MSNNRNVRRKALRAMKAVTAGAILFAGVACSDDESGGTTFNVGEEDAGTDAATADTGGDTSTEDAGGDTEVADAGPDIGPADTGPVDTGTDAGGDTDPSDTGTDAGGDTDPSDVGTDTEVADADSGRDCNDEESTGECPDHCTMDDDVDCCEEIGGFWSDGFCAVAVPGPFVPPAMPA